MSRSYSVEPGSFQQLHFAFFCTVKSRSTQTAIVRMHTTTINLNCFTVKLESMFGSKFNGTDSKTGFGFVNYLIIFYNPYLSLI